MREIIIAEIRRLAELHGRAPGSAAFVTETGIARHEWRGRYWARWGDALSEAGYQANQWSERSDPNDLLKGMVVACRHYGHLPTYDEMRMLRRADQAVPSPRVLSNNFAGRCELIAALRNYTASEPALADVAAMLPKQEDRPAQSEALPTAPSKAVEGHVYLIRSGDFYKVGRSDDLERRVKEIRIALPDKAELVHAIRTDDPPGIEAYWHRRFADRRANGEWFKLRPADLAAFRKRNFQ